jgi:hypothetical protein
LAPYGIVYSYQASKWYVTEEAARRFPGLVKHMKDGEIESYDPETKKARTIEPHFDSGNAMLWGLCIIFGRCEPSVAVMQPTP